MSESRPAARLVVDVALYTVARLLLVTALAAAIVFVANLLGIGQFPIAVAILFAVVIAFPLGIYMFAPLRRRATESIAVFDERRRRDREQLQARLRGDDTPGPS